MHAFVDDYGDTGLSFHKPNVSSHFILAAVLVEKDNIETVDRFLDETIASKYFQGSEIKSSLVGQKHSRREKILRRLSGLGFKLYALVVDKTALCSEGYRYHDSFMKSLHGMIDRALFCAFPNLKLTADEHDDQQFMGDFKRYIASRHQPDLFNQSEFSFVSSSANRIVQLADFLAGTLARHFDRTKHCKEGNEFIKILKEQDQLLQIRVFPERPDEYVSFLQAQQQNDFDKELLRYSVELALKYTKDHDSSPKPIEKARVAVLRLLLDGLLYQPPGYYVFADELAATANCFEGVKIQSRQIGRQVIGRLRYEGVMITSGHKGYKLVADMHELYGFLEWFNKYIPGMLKKIETYRNQIKLLTKGKVDILERQDFSYLREFFDK